MTSENTDPQCRAAKHKSMANLSKIPKDWKKVRLGYSAWVRARLGWKGLKAEEYVDDGFIFLSTPNIKGRKIDFSQVNYISKERYDESPEIMLRVDDVVLAKDGSTLGTVNVVRTLPRPATVNSSIAVLTPYQMLRGEFLYFWFQTADAIGQIQQAKGGMGVPHLFQDDLVRFVFPLPPLQQQDEVIAFLNREIDRIDLLIEKQKRLIDFLTEKRQAVISHAITNGLDKAVLMKDSGMAWLGEVPSHWIIKRLKHVTSFVTSGSRGWAEYYSDDGSIFIRITNLTRHGIDLDLSDIQYVQPPTSEADRSRVETGDIVISITADLGSVACIPVLPARGFVSQHVALVRPTLKTCSRWLAFAVKSGSSMEQLRQAAYGGTKIQLSLSDICDLWLAVPPMTEQIAIQTFLDHETAKIDTLIAKANQSIELMKERRSALISAAVTGKIDVREAA